MNCITIGENEQIKTIKEGLKYYTENLNQTIINELFIIFLKPGIYKENFEIPRNVLIKGSDKNASIIVPQYISTSLSSNNQTNTHSKVNLITLNSQSQLKNITLSLKGLHDCNENNQNNENVTCNIIHSNNKSDIVLENIIVNDTKNQVSFKNSNNLKQKTINLFSFYGGYNNSLYEFDIDINQNYFEFTSIYAKQTQLKIQNVNITYHNSTKNNYCVYLDNNNLNNICITNCLFLMESNSNNYGIFHYNSYSSIVSTVIKIYGQNESLYNNAIKCVSDNKHKFAKLYLKFDHDNYVSVDKHNQNILVLNQNSNQNNVNSDELINLELEYDFISCGFIEGQSIKINNKEFKILQVLETYLVLDKPIEFDFDYVSEDHNGNILESNSLNIVQIEELISVELINCYLETDLNLINYELLELDYLKKQKKNNCIETDDILKLFKIHIHNSTLLGGNMDKCLNSQIIFNTPQIVVIGRYNSHYQTLNEALKNINSNFDNYILKLNPGTYKEIAPLLLKNNLVIRGFGKSLTKIILKKNMLLNDNLKFENLTIVISNNNIKNIIIENKNNIIFENVNFELDDLYLERNINSSLNINICNLFYCNKSNLEFINCNVNLTKNNFNNNFSLIESHLSNCKFNNCNFINHSNNFNSPNYLIKNLNSYLIFNDCSFELNSSIVCLFQKSYYLKAFLTRFNHSIFNFENTNSDEINSDTSISTNFIFIDYSETVSNNNNSLFLNNCQTNKEIAYNNTNQFNVNVILYNTYFIDKNGFTQILSKSGYLDNNNNINIQSIDSFQNQKNKFKSNKNNILIGDNLTDNIQGNNNIVVSNKNDKNDKNDKNTLLKINNKLIVKSLNDNNLITGDLSNNNLIINSSLDKINSIYSNNLENNLKLSINGAINASHYLNFKSTCVVEFLDHEHKNNVKPGMVLSSIRIQNKPCKNVHNTDNTDNTDDNQDKFLVELSNYNCNSLYFGIYYSKIENNLDICVISGITEILVIMDYDCDSQVLKGDLFTSSEITGYAKKQEDNIIYNYTIGKSLESIENNEQFETIIFKSKKYKIKKIKCKLF